MNNVTGHGRIGDVEASFFKKFIYTVKSLKDRAFWAALLPLAIPIALQNLLTNSFQLVDTLMIGKLGDTAIGAVGAAGRVSFFAGIVIFGVCSGGAVFIAQYWGAKDIAGVRRAYGLITLITTAFAALLSLLCFIFPTQVLSILTNDADKIADGAEYLRIACFSYIGIALSQCFGTALRCTEKVKLPMYVSFASVVLNALLNYTFIFGKFGAPELGIVGAGVATTVSALLNPILLLLFSIRSGNVLTSKPRDMFDFSGGFVGRFIRRAYPVVLNELFWVTGMTIYDMVYGRMQPTDYTALTVFRTIESLSFVLFMGVCNSCNVVVGMAVGEGDYHRAKLDAARYLLLVPAIGTVMGVIMILVRAPILSLFDISAEAAYKASVLLLIYACEMSLRNIPYMSICGIFRAAGDTKSGLYFEMGDYYLFAIPLTIVLGLVVKLDFLWVYLIMLLAEDVPKSILCMWRFLTFKWIKPVTEMK